MWYYVKLAGILLLVYSLWAYFFRWRKINTLAKVAYMKGLEWVNMLPGTVLPPRERATPDSIVTYLTFFQGMSYDVLRLGLHTARGNKEALVKELSVVLAKTLVAFEALEEEPRRHLVELLDSATENPLRIKLMDGDFDLAKEELIAEE